MFSLLETLSLEKNEHLVTTIRSHTFRTVARVIPLVLILFGLFLFLFPLFSLGMIGVGIFFIGGIIDAIVLARVLIKWYGSVYILTELRLFSIDRQGFFKKRVNEIVLENINELSYDTKGVFPTLFGYGDIQCSLFTTRGSFTIYSVMRPNEFLGLISKYVALAKRGNTDAGKKGNMDTHEFEKKMLPIKKTDLPNWL